MTTLRQQLMMKRTLRNLRTWAPPISIGVIVGALTYFAIEQLSDAPALALTATASPQTLAAEIDVRHQTAAFANCAAARTAGAAPIRAGQPGYGDHLDADGDGIGCEPYPR